MATQMYAPTKSGPILVRDVWQGGDSQCLYLPAPDRAYVFEHMASNANSDLVGINRGVHALLARYVDGDLRTIYTWWDRHVRAVDGDTFTLVDGDTAELWQTKGGGIERCADPCEVTAPGPWYGWFRGRIYKIAMNGAAVFFIGPDWHATAKRHKMMDAHELRLMEVLGADAVVLSQDWVFYRDDAWRMGTMISMRWPYCICSKGGAVTLYFFDGETFRVSMMARELNKHCVLHRNPASGLVEVHDGRAGDWESGCAPGDEVHAEAEASVRKHQLLSLE